jgi:hypothetical protein
MDPPDRMPFEFPVCEMMRTRWPTTEKRIGKKQNVPFLQLSLLGHQITPEKLLCSVSILTLSLRLSS